MKIETIELKKLILELRQKNTLKAKQELANNELSQANRTLGVGDGLEMIYELLDNIERVVVK